MVAGWLAPAKATCPSQHSPSRPRYLGCYLANWIGNWSTVMRQVEEGERSPPFPLLQPCVRMKLWSLSRWLQPIVPQVPGQMRPIRIFPWQLLNGAPGSQSVFVGKSEMPGYRLLPTLLLLMETKPSKGTKPAEREEQTQRRKCLVMFKPLVLSSHGGNWNTALVCRRKKKKSPILPKQTWLLENVTFKLILLYILRLYIIINN